MPNGWILEKQQSLAAYKPNVPCINNSCHREIDEAKIAALFRAAFGDCLDYNNPIVLGIFFLEILDLRYSRVVGDVGGVLDEVLASIVLVYFLLIFI